MTYPTPYTILEDTVHFKEFYGGFNGTCGETAATSALICALKLGYSHDQAVAMMLSVTHEMQAKGWASANGASTLWSLAREAIVRHATIALEYDYQEPLKQDWHSVLLANAGIRPIVLQVGLAENLWGQDGTGNDEAGVHYHFICVVGKCADGYICMDGDNWKIEQELSIYSYATLQAADICGLLMLEVTPRMAIPTNWKDSANGDATKEGVLTAPNGKTLVRGFRSHVLSHEPQWPEALVPLDEEAGDGKGGTTQNFGLRLFWSSATNVVEQDGEAVQAPPPPPAKTDPAIVAALDAAAQYLSQPSQLASEVAAAQAKVVR